MRPIDADQLLDFIRFDERVIAPEEHTAQDIVMMIQTAPTITPPPNDPLTLEQLREMADEIADDFISYVTGGVQNAAPYCANMCPECCERPNWCTGYSNKCKGFFPKAYRRKPEEGTNAAP